MHNYEPFSIQRHIIVLKITLLHSVSVITNFVIPHAAWQTNKKTNKKTLHFFVYSRRATHDPHYTWHGDRGGPCHFCTPIYLIRSVVSPLGAIEYLWKSAPTEENCSKLGCLSPESNQIKTSKLPVDEYKRWEFRKNCANASPLRCKFVGKIANFYHFVGCIPTFLPI